MQGKTGKKLRLSKKAIIAILLACAVVLGTVAAILFIGPLFAPEKSIAVFVNDTENNIQNIYRYKTKEKTLADALLAEKLIEGKQEVSGYVLVKVDGKKAEPVKYQCWAIHVNGVRGEQDATKVILKDGDQIELRLEYWQ